MSFVLVQNDLTTPTTEAFRAAFRAVKGFTEADANRVAREAYGVLMRNLTFDHAIQLQQAMTTHGIATVVIPDQEIPRLPEPKTTRRVELGTSGLKVYDAIGRATTYDWNQLAVIAAGIVPKVDIVRFETTEQRLVIGGPGYVHTEMVKTMSHKLQANTQRLIHLLTDGNPVRIEIDIDTLFFKYALPEAPADPGKVFGELTRRLAAQAPRACLNRGAVELNGGAAQPMTYSSRATFADECTWLMWMATRPEAGPE